jgi:hypothetical protein
MRKNPDIIQTEFRRLSPASVKLHGDAFNHLVLELDGVVYERVKPVRSFPLTAASTCVFLLDSEGNQIGMIPDITELPADSRSVLEQRLESLYFSTRVVAIAGVKSRHGVTTWNLRTTRGDTTIYVKDRNDIRTLPGKRMILTDTNGMRYEIANIDKLDDKSQGALEAET